MYLILFVFCWFRGGLMFSPIVMTALGLFAMMPLINATNAD